MATLFTNTIESRKDPNEKSLINLFERRFHPRRFLSQPRIDSGFSALTIVAPPMPPNSLWESNLPSCAGTSCTSLEPHMHQNK